MYEFVVDVLSNTRCVRRGDVILIPSHRILVAQESSKYYVVLQAHNNKTWHILRRLNRENAVRLARELEDRNKLPISITFTRVESSVVRFKC